ncbi:BEL1-like homeodomain protein 9 [Curcuma longa]|uniref:BEL1-like homeodomain protein 9 n=1 Tax=Curcuma longa TaxID=136217 RepID=UPI003D9E2CDB
MTSLGGGGGVGGGQGEEQLQLLRHQPQTYSFHHVPQHSRREKLRFPLDDEPPPPAVASVLHEQSPLYPANSFAPFLPSVSYPYQGDVHVAGSASVPISGNQIQNQGFSLSLSSQSRPTQLGPFTGYATVLSRSRFLEPARKLLDEVCRVDGQGVKGFSTEVDPATDWALPEHGGKEGREWRDSRLLLSLLDEVYRRYKHYYQQVQTVITSFESVAGLSTAAPYALMALIAMSKNFRYLKNSISHQFHQTSKRLRDQGINGDNISNIGFLETSHHPQRSTCSPAAAFSQPHVWRPQRGLPERAVSVLRSWLFEHFLHPYPTDVDKQNLAKQTGLTRNQVSNWFINARVRLWKPMVEDIYSLEMRQKNKMSAVTEGQPQPPSSCMTNPVDAQSLGGQDNRCSSSRGIQDNNLAPMPHHIHESVLNFVGHDMSNHDNVGVGVGNGSLANGVSLTLGLHQNNGVCFTEPIPLTVPRRFGLDECTETYMASAFGAEQDRQLVKDVGGRLLHDFVG